MNKEQFLAMQLAVQDAADDVDRPKRVSHAWEQESWFRGPAASDVTVAKKHGEPLIPLMVTCHSSACIAGNGIINAGDRMLADRESGRFDYDTETGQMSDVKTYSAEYCLTLEGKVRKIEKRAAELFGLTTHEADQLFSAGNDLDSIIEYAEEFAVQHGHELFIDRDPARFDHPITNNTQELIDA